MILESTAGLLLVAAFVMALRLQEAYTSKPATGLFGNLWRRWRPSTGSGRAAKVVVSHVRAIGRVVKNGTVNILYSDGTMIPAIAGGDGTTVLELKREHAKVVADARAIVDRAEEEYREKQRESADLTQEEQNSYDEAFKRANELKGRIKRHEELEAEERYLESTPGPSHKPAPEKRDDDNPENRGGDPGADDSEDRGVRPTSEHRAAFEAFLRNAHRMDTPRNRREYQEAFRSFLRGGVQALSAEEHRALEATSDVAGGYTVPPEQFVARLIRFVDDFVFVRQRATVLPPLTNADSLGAPSLDADPSDADWTTELDTGGEDSDMKFGKRALHPQPVAKLIKVSNTLIRRSAMSIETLVRERLGYKFGVTGEKAYLTGHGAGQPLGVFTASADGISTSRDVSTGNTTTSIQTDGLQEVKWSLKPQHRMRARWMFHTDALKQIAKLKDGDGQYIWQPGIVAGAPDRLMNLPYDESQFAPNTFTTGQYVGILANWEFYWIVDALSMTIQRLVELYARTNQVGFIARLETDGMPVLEEAFSRVKLA